MFTGIVEALAEVTDLQPEGENLRVTLCPPAAFQQGLRVDQSVAHNGVCLTVERLLPGSYQVVAIPETLQRTNLDALAVGDLVNLERSLRADSRLDGHFVQGHVDTVAEVREITQLPGTESWYLTVAFAPEFASLVVEKGSISLNGVSLTVVTALPAGCSVALIPYTYHHTTFRWLKAGDHINVEFDILGKYLLRYLSLRGATGS